MRLLVTGATGFTGSYVVRRLLEKGHDVCCFVRRSSDRSVLPAGKIEWYEGDLGDFETLRRAAHQADALVNIASIGFGHAPDIVRAALASGVKRTLFISTTAIFTSLKAPSKKIRLAAEDEIQRSGLEFTILRPTMIYGSRRDRNMCRLIRFLDRYPLFPILGNGENLQQPVYVADVALAAADCLEERSTIGKAYNIPGGSPLTFNQVIDTVCGSLGRKVMKLHFPASPAIAFLNFLEHHGLQLPIKGEQVQRLNEDKAFSYDEAAKDFGYAPRTFEEGIALEIEEMGLNADATNE